MELRKAKKVAIKKFGPIQGPTYSDGADEKTLLEILSEANAEQQVAKLLSNQPSWPILYHLHPSRENILNWYPFKEGTSILEVGAGCGAVTGCLLRAGCSVTAVELSGQRAEICAQRHSQAENLEVLVGNIRHFQPAQKFDYVVCIGVLEYAETYIGGENAAEEFIRLVEAFLKPGGVLLLAIENQLGLKYFAGAQEDHTGLRFSGLNDYRQAHGVRTFARRELHQLISANGFSSTYFYYPFPDYKFPVLIYSDDYYPGQSNVTFPKNFLPTPTLDHNRCELFSESALMNVFERNGLFKDFSNSFLVEAVRNE